MLNGITDVFISLSVQARRRRAPSPMRTGAARGIGWASACMFAFMSGYSGLTAQITLSTIRGTAADPSGAIVGDAQIALTNKNTGERREALTNANGDFEIPGLQRGVYRLTASKAGFKSFTADQIMLEATETRRVNVIFELGSVGSEVTVNAGAAVIQTDTVKLQNSIDTSTHFDTPWVAGSATFDPSLFITSAPLVNQSSGMWSSQWAGQSSSQVQEGQDGHTNDGAVNQLNNILDAQEVTVVTANNSAEYARVGYLNLVTKSGSNDFHGRLAYFHQNSALGARNFFEDQKAKQLTHTISVSASGPIIKNRTFFYASVNILRIPGKQFYLRDVPTDAMRRGDFSQLLSGSKPITITDPTTGQPFPGNVIPANRISAVSQAVNEKYLPAPNRGGLASNFGFTFPFPDDYSLRKDFTQRIDHQLTKMNRLMGRLVEDWGLYVLPSNFPSFAWTRVRFNVHMVVEDTHVFSPALVNSLRVGLYKEKVTDGDTVYGVTPFKGDEAVNAIGLKGVNPRGYSAQGFPVMSISGYPTLSTRPGGVVQNDHDWGYADTMTWSKGRHVIKFGGEYKPQSRFVGNIPEGTYGSFAFNGSVAGYGYADFLLGIPFTSTRLDPLTERTMRDSELGLFLTDSFKVNSRLTLDLGLRWDRFGSPSYSDGLQYNWDPATGNVIVPEDKLNKVSPLYPKSIKVVAGDVRQSPSSKNFVPRIGAAYRISDRWVVRGGYGIFNETVGRYSRLSSAPFQISETYQNVITNGQPLLAFPNPFPGSLAGARIPSQSVTGYPINTSNGKIHQYNATLERQIGDTGLRLSYVGSHDYGMNYSISVNKPEASLIPFTAARAPYPQVVNAAYYRSNGESKFNAVTIEGIRKVGQVTFDAHWTLASSYSNFQSGANLENPYGPLSFARDRYTPRQRVVVNLVWDVPVGRGRKLLSNANPVVDGVLGGWQLYWIGYFESGHYFSPAFSGSDPSNTNTFGGLPDRSCNGNLPASQRGIGKWFDTSCFATPRAGTLGNSGAFVLEGPGYNMQHISVAKTFRLTERVKFTFTAAASNVLNHPNFGLPASNISVPASAGVVSSLVAGSASRLIDLRGRIDF
ncbi:MAG: TonB-dependent receptor [Bryobacterales bacterium]|nr:TonB-dependent receptor [Bryobacterales bacterium]